MPERYGADPERWAYWTRVLGGTADLLPVVSNPNAEISARSTMQSLGKTPSRYNHERKVVGIGDWTNITPTASEARRWAQEPDYGICIQTRRLRAIDIDVEDREKSVAVRGAIDMEQAPIRVRDGTGKCLIPFWYDGELPKHVIPVDGGMVEILADGQQFVAEGQHSGGLRYYWDVGDIPTLDELDFAMLLADLKAIATGEIKVARRKRDKPIGEALAVDDETADWLVNNWEIFDHGNDGQIFIRCPFEGEHSTDTGPGSTCYFPAGTGGYAEGNFVCLHAHCTGRAQAEFLHATGATAGAFGDAELPDAGVHEGTGDHASLRGGSPVQIGTSTSGNADRAGLGEIPGDRERDRPVGLVSPDDPLPRLTRVAATGEIHATMRNLLLAVAHPGMTGRHVAYDIFLDEIMWAPGSQPRGEAQWRAWRDSDYAWLRMALEERGFKPMGKEMLRDAVLAVAERNRIDQAQTWLGRLVWDGQERVRRFAALAWGWDDTPYAEAVSRYTWTALAGRVIEPGVQADMAPILIGPQGMLKTSAIMAMAPSEDFYTSIKLDDKDADLSRKMRGRLVAEIEELRGLNSKAVEEIKAFITRRKEEWIPKFREFRIEFRRRLLFIGSGNDEQFLNDPTGERRWLPGECKRRLDIDWIRDNRDQLWAEGAALFALDGVDWKEAETLARLEHDKFKIEDPWTPFVIRWLHDENATVEGKPIGKAWLTTSEALTGAVNHRPEAINLGLQMRMGKVLKNLGFERKRQRVPGIEEPLNTYIPPQ